MTRPERTTDPLTSAARRTAPLGSALAPLMSQLPQTMEAQIPEQAHPAALHRHLTPTASFPPRQAWNHQGQTAWKSPLLRRARRAWADRGDQADRSPTLSPLCLISISLERRSSVRQRSRLMQHTIEHGSAFAWLKILLAPGDTIRAEAGAMVRHTPGVEMDTRLNSGHDPGV